MASNRFSRLRKIFSGAAADAEDEIFLLEGRLERFVHFWVLVIRQFVRHRCLVRASALSYSTLIALIPLLAVALSVASGFLKTQDEAQFQQAIEHFVDTVTPPAVITATETNLGAVISTNVLPLTTTGGETNVVAIATNVAAATTPAVAISTQKEIARQVWMLVQNTQSAALGVTGFLLLLFISISLMIRIEETFNDVWGVARGRTWMQRIGVFFTLAFLGPALLILALSLSGSAHFTSAKNFIAHTPVIGQFIFQLLPMFVLWLAFTFVYQFIPNTKVNFSAAVVGGVVAGTLLHLNNVFGFLYVSGVVTRMKFYGGLGLVPVFMIGLYMAWVFLLLGAQIAYAFQNRAAYLQDRLADNVNQRGREFVALRLMTCLGQRFQNGLPPATVFQLSTELGIPSRLTQSVLRTLAHMRLVTEVAGAEAAFMPARPLETINAYDILIALRTGTGQELPMREEPALAEIYGEFSRIEKAEREAASSISLLALANRISPRTTLAASKIVEVEKQLTYPEIPEPQSISAAPLPGPEKPEPLPVFFPTEEKTEVAKPGEPPTRRRDVVMPEENREFPL